MLVCLMHTRAVSQAFMGQSTSSSRTDESNPHISVFIELNANELNMLCKQVH